TLETYVAKGRIAEVISPTSFALEIDGQKPETFLAADDKIVREVILNLKKGQRVAVVATTDGRQRAIALEVSTDEGAVHPLWRDDITVRVTTETLEFKNGVDEVVHKYLLYNGPVKPSLLGMPGHESVSPALIERYV